MLEAHPAAHGQIKKVGVAGLNRPAPLRKSAAQDARKKLDGINVQRLCNLAEFHQIDAPLTSFNAPNEIVRFAELRCEFTLTQPQPMAKFHNRPNNSAVGRAP
jgi:hypothetical protein